ncbi:hypothetical protein BDZ97DRAFT_1840841 [Flammula alnicola]|nr:hypothetical protein BDZ97DRAFT_1840841 [Flammula alnicola]
MAPNNKEGEVEDTRRFVPSIRSILYALGFFLIFSLTCAELGLVSQQIHKFGRFAENYASLEYKNSLGLLLAAVIISLLLCFAHFWTPVGVATFVALILAVFFGTGAGIIQKTTPFTGHGCHKLSQNDYPEKWRPFFQQCSRIVAIQGVAWSLWVLYVWLFFGSLIYMFRISVKPTPGGFYASANRAV